MSANSVPSNYAAYHAPLRPALWGALAIVAFVCMFFAWGYLAPLSSAAIAEGSLQVRAQRQSVQHPDGGVIARLLVTEGQQVKRGQPLIELDDTSVRAEFDIADAEVVSLLAQQARLICERDNKGAPCMEALAKKNEASPKMTEAIANERAVMEARAQQYEAEKGMLASKIAQLAEKISSLRAQVQGLFTQRELLADELKRTQKLFKSGLTSKTRVQQLQRSIAQLIADQGSRKADIAGAKQEIAEAKLASAKLDRDRISNITDKFRVTQASLAGAGPKLQAARQVMERTVIRAPMSGSIVDLTVFTEGGVIKAGERVMDIVPEDNPIIVEGRLPLTDINGVVPGDVADVHLTGVPRKDRPRLNGRVISVSADKVTDNRSGVSYFAIRVGLDQNDMQQSRIPLRPGMSAEVIIPKESRTLVGYLLAPLLDHITHVFREE